MILFNSALVRQLLLDASKPPDFLLAQATILHSHYSTLHPSHHHARGADDGGVERSEGEGSSVSGNEALHPAVQILKRMASKTKPLLLQVDWTDVADQLEEGKVERMPSKLFYKEGDDLLQVSKKSWAVWYPPSMTAHYFTWPGASTLLYLML